MYPSLNTKIVLLPFSLALLLVIAACSSSTPQAAGPPPRPVVPVSVAVASQETVPLQIRVVGNVEAASTVQIKSKVAGELTAVKFAEGANVNKGDLLFEIDPRPYREAL